MNNRGTVRLKEEQRREMMERREENKERDTVREHQKACGQAPRNQHPITQRTACIPSTHGASPPDTHVSTQTRGRTHSQTPSIPPHNHQNVVHITQHAGPPLRGRPPYQNKTSEFPCSVLGGSKSAPLRQFSGLSPAAGLKTSSTDRL